MNILITVGLQITIFSLGMFCGALIADIEWYDTLTNDFAKCSILDTQQLCDAKIKFNKAIKEFNNAN